MMLLLQLFIDGLTSGALYALMAVGFAIIYNGTRILHLAHGAVFTFGLKLILTLPFPQMLGDAIDNWPFLDDTCQVVEWLCQPLRFDSVILRTPLEKLPFCYNNFVWQTAYRLAILTSPA